MDRKHEKYERLLALAKALPPLPTAVVHCCDESSLTGAVEAAQMGLIAPVLIGPMARIKTIAHKCGLDISRFEIVDTPHSHASASEGVRLVREGRAECLMKGSLHTDELMGAVVARETGLRTARRVSHCFVMDVPGHPDPLIISDAAVNIAPTLEDKVDIVQNAIDLAHALRVAVKDAQVMRMLQRLGRLNPQSCSRAIAILIRSRVDCRAEARLGNSGGVEWRRSRVVGGGIVE
jgi:phosphate acetyltransferase